MVNHNIKHINLKKFSGEIPRSPFRRLVNHTKGAILGERFLQITAPEPSKYKESIIFVAMVPNLLIWDLKSLKIFGFLRAKLVEHLQPFVFLSRSTNTRLESCIYI